MAYGPCGGMGQFLQSLTEFYADSKKNLTLLEELCYDFSRSYQKGNDGIMFLTGCFREPAEAASRCRWQ